jgi:Winged helix DNA-binding domain
VRADTTSARALNRATLARQLLLERASLPALDAVQHLVGIQAQEPHDPYTALWSRLEGFRPEQLSELLESRQVVRIVVMRGTIHLVSAADALVLRPLMQPVLDGELARHPEFSPPLRDLDLEPVLAVARAALEERPLTGTELRAVLVERFPELDARALAYACRNHLALVQVPPRGLWGRRSQVRSTTLRHWLGRPLATAPSLEDVVLRYLGAFGPASPADVAAWSRLTGLRAVIEHLRPRLRAFRAENGRELFDLPDAPRPDPETPAPVRFLPEYDNALLSHADRSRFAAQGLRVAVTGEWVGRGAVLHDGVVVGSWRREGAQVAVRFAVELPKRARAEIVAEGRRLAAFLSPAASEADMHLLA